MAGQIREDALAAIFEGIVCAFQATEADRAGKSQDSFNHCMSYARAAIAALEDRGFTIVWKGTPADHRDWRDGKIVPLR